MQGNSVEDSASNMNGVNGYFAKLNLKVQFAFAKTWSEAAKEKRVTFKVEEECTGSNAGKRWYFTAVDCQKAWL